MVLLKDSGIFAAFPLKTPDVKQKCCKENVFPGEGEEDEPGMVRVVQQSGWTVVMY